MAFRKDAALRLMVVDDSVEAAEAIVSGLRNSGIAVRPSRPENEAELASLLEQQPPDLVLVDPQASGVPLAAVLQAVSASGKDLPVLFLAEHVDDALLMRAMEAGARGMVIRRSVPHLQSVVRSEWADLEARRALRRLEAHVRETERRCDALIDSSRDPIAYIHEGMHIRANQAYLEVFGFESFDDIEGMPLLDLVAPAQVGAFKQLLKEIARGDAPPRFETEARTMEGESFKAVMEFTPATYEGEPCLQVVIRRQEIDPALAREVEELRQRDMATGLLNRATFLRTLEDAVAAAAQGDSQHALLLVEPDHYARLLQDIGLDAADALIAALAERLRRVLGEDAVAARFGEHQLAVLVRNASHKRSLEVAEAVRAAFAGHVIETERASLNATVSVGGVQISEKIASISAVLGKAAQCVQSAAGVGGNRVELFDPGAADRAEEERIEAWVKRIRDALDGDRFTMFYQPLVHLHGEPVEMYETFLRLQGEPGELIQPLTFLQIAEEHGLLWEIDRWVVGRAIQVIGERLRGGRRTRLLVKITQASLQDDTLAAFIEEQLAKHKVDGELLVMQLPESKVFTHLRAAQALQERVSRHGVKVGLEQFGAGLNSFQLLSHFPADFLKIDRSFTQDLATNPASQQRVREIAAKAQEMGKQALAEFVQDAATMTILFSAGVHYAQGHFLAPAGPAMDYEFDV